MPGFPPLTQLCVCVCVFFFHALGSEEGVSHDSSFLGVVTTIIVARLSPRTLVSFWVCDISWWPPKTSDLYTHTGIRRHCQRRDQTGCTACVSVYVHVWKDPGVYFSHVNQMFKTLVQACVETGYRSIWKQGKWKPPDSQREHPNWIMSLKLEVSYHLVLLAVWVCTFVSACDGKF